MTLITIFTRMTLTLPYNSLYGKTGSVTCITCKSGSQATALLHDHHYQQKQSFIPNVNQHSNRLEQISFFSMQKHMQIVSSVNLDVRRDTRTGIGPYWRIVRSKQFSKSVINVKLFTGQVRLALGSVGYLFGLLVCCHRAKKS